MRFANTPKSTSPESNCSPSSGRRVLARPPSSTGSASLCTGRFPGTVAAIVAPVVTQGLTESVVSLAFSVGDDHYQVARHVRKDSKRGTATTDEATLEKAGEVLATGADAVTSAVVALLGLDFEQFTTCVLLPQGEFQRFLHDKPANRQNLLSALLDLGIYERIGQRASERRERAGGQLATIDQRLASLGTIGDLDEESAASAAAALTASLGEVELSRARTRGAPGGGKGGSDRGRAHEQLAQRAGEAEPARRSRLHGGRQARVRRESGRNRRRPDRDRGPDHCHRESARHVADLEAPFPMVDDMDRVARHPGTVGRGQCRCCRSPGTGDRGSTGPARRQAGAGRSHRPEPSCPSPTIARSRTPLPGVRSNSDHSPAVHWPNPRSTRLDQPWKRPRRRWKSSPKRRQRRRVPCSGWRRGWRDFASRQRSRRRRATSGDRRQVADADDQLRQARKDDESIKRRHDEVEQGRKRLADRERDAMRDLQNARDRLAGLDPPQLSFDDPATDWKSLIAWATEQAQRWPRPKPKRRPSGRRLPLGSR